MKFVAAACAATAAMTAVGVAGGVVGGVSPRSGWRTQPFRDIRNDAVSGLVVAALGVVATGIAAAGAAGALLGWSLSRRRRIRVRALRTEEIRRAWPDAIRMVAAGLRSGASVRSAMTELAATAPDALRPVLGDFVSRERVLGVRGALIAIGGELADPVADRVVEVLVVADERGGALVPGILDDLADALGADLVAAEEIRTQSLEQRLNARIVTVAPWAVLLLLVAREGPYRAFYGSRPGVVVLASGAALTAAGGVLVRRLASRSPEPRVLEHR